MPNWVLCIYRQWTIVCLVYQILGMIYNICFRTVAYCLLTDIAVYHYNAFGRDGLDFHHSLLANICATKGNVLSKINGSLFLDYVV